MLFTLPAMVFPSTKPKKSPDNNITRSPTHTRESCRRHGDSIVMESPHHPVENVNFMLYYSSAEFERQSDGNRRPRYRPCVCMYGNFPFKSEWVHVFVAKWKSHVWRLQMSKRSSGKFSEILAINKHRKAPLSHSDKSCRGLWSDVFDVFVAALRNRSSVILVMNQTSCGRGNADRRDAPK